MEDTHGDKSLQVGDPWERHKCMKLNTYYYMINMVSYKRDKDEIYLFLIMLIILQILTILKIYLICILLFIL